MREAGSLTSCPGQSLAAFLAAGHSTQHPSLTSHAFLPPYLEVHPKNMAPTLATVFHS